MDYYVRVNGAEHTRAVRGDQAAMPIEVYDSAGRLVRRCRALPLAFRGHPVQAGLYFDPTRSYAASASIVLAIKGAEEVDGVFVLDPQQVGSLEAVEVDAKTLSLALPGTASKG